MPLEVVIWTIPGHPRSTAITAAMQAGIARHGDKVRVITSQGYRQPIGDVGLFYGLAGRLALALKDYPRQQKPAVYVDLGFWGRKDGGRFSGYHKLSVNGRHPTDYFQRVKHGPGRADHFGLKPRPWRKDGRHILICGMGPKGARAEGYAPTQWEREAVTALRKVTDRPILYRPKPNWPHPPAIPGATLTPEGQDLDAALAGCHAVVTHHSNAAIEAITAGVPAFVVEGCALPMALTDIAKIETPAYRDGRRQWLNDLAWCQWSVPEMASGEAWAYLKGEGLVG